jgi:hypothetical protein
MPETVESAISSVSAISAAVKRRLRRASSPEANGLGQIWPPGAQLTLQRYEHNATFRVNAQDGRVWATGLGHESVSGV